jgi:hypothetical protein
LLAVSPLWAFLFFFMLLLVSLGGFTFYMENDFRTPGATPTIAAFTTTTLVL